MSFLFSTLLLLLFSNESRAQCQSIPDMPTARRHSSAVIASDGIIYVMGGYDANDRLTDVVEAYDPVLNSWTTHTKLPEPLMGMSVVAGEDRKIYVIGGQRGSAHIYPSNKVYIYNTKNMSWTTGKEMPMARGRKFSSAIGLKNGKIYLLGGTYDGRNLSTALIYNSIKDSWAPAAPMNTKRMGFALTEGDGGKLYALGGYCVDECGDDETYDPSTGSWGFIPAMIKPREDFYAFKSKDGKIYALPGGNNGGSPNLETTTIEVFDPNSKAWKVFLTLDESHAGYSAVQDKNGLVYMFGQLLYGQDANGYFNTANAEVTTFNTNTGEWCISKGVH